MLHISLSGETIFHIGSFPVTNSLLTTWIVMAILIVLSWGVKSSLSKIPGKFQISFELIIQALYDMFEGVLGKQVKVFFPLLATFFLFIICSNWFGLLPGVGSIGIWEGGESSEKMEAVKTLPEESHTKEIPAELAEVKKDEHGAVIEEVVETEKAGTETATVAEHAKSEKKLVPLFRAPTADLNTTLGLALISFIALQFFGLKTLGMQYVQKFFNFTNPINFYVGILEIISEFGKIVSFGFRLFGNIFAGEVLLTVIAFLVPLVAPIPFIGLELFVGLIQALVFSMLTAVFLATATSKEGH